MVTNPEQWIHDFADANASVITVHQESTKKLLPLIKKIKSFGKKAGVSLNPATPIETIVDVLPELDLVLVMSVNPGFAGQKFMPEVVEKISRLHALRTKENYKFLIEIDGGVNASNLELASKAGCDVFVAGSAIFNSDNYAKTISELKNQMA